MEVSYDVAVLDIMMPKLDGLALLQRMRTKGMGLPVLMLTAKGSLEDRVSGLEAGADDYLPKPFDSREFIARVKALSRRNAQYVPAVLSIGNIRLDRGRFELTVGERSVRLNNKEFQMLELFMKYPRFVFSAEHLREKIWGQDAEAGLNVVWTYIGFLRRKLKDLNASVRIRTIRGAGYSLEEIC